MPSLNLPWQAEIKSQRPLGRESQQEPGPLSPDPLSCEEHRGQVFIFGVRCARLTPWHVR